MEKRIICSGSGGQGVLVMGKLLAQAGLIQDKRVTWLPSYGAEMRGGTAHCMVIISNEPIASPYVEFCDDAILMNTASVTKFIPKVKGKGLVVINKPRPFYTKETLNDKKGRGEEDLDELAIPKTLRIINRDFTKEAVGLGNKQIANIIALGAYISGTKIFCQSDLEKALEEIFSAKGSQILRLNKLALQRGIELGGM